MRNRLQRMQGDEGVALVLALVFLLVVGLFITVALDKNASTSLVGVQVRDRSQLQYALDGAVDRTLQRLRAELSSGSPATCTSPTTPPGSGTFTLNGKSASWACSTLAGKAALTGDAAATNFAVVVTGAADGALRTQSGTSQDLQVGGSVFLNGRVDNGDVGKPVEITSGDLVRPKAATCKADLAALTKVSLTGTGQLRSCTEQTLAQSLPTVSLPATPPTLDLSPLLGSGVTLTSKGRSCTVFYPGLYRTPPVLANDSHNYFVSGLYYFDFAGQWQVDDTKVVVTGGAKQAGSSDVSAPSNDCAVMGVTDSVALGDSAVAALVGAVNPYAFTHGTTWVFTGTAGLDVKKGSITLLSPPSSGSSVPVNLVGTSTYTASAYGTQPVGTPLLTGGGNNSAVQVNAKVFAPNSHVEVFSTNGTVAAARGGVVANTLQLKASASGSDALVITATTGAGTPPPPFRTVLVETTDGSGGTTAKQRAVATISNYSPFTVDVKSWRSQ